MTDGELYVDFPDGVKRVMNKPGTYVRLLAKFRDAPGIDGLESALASGDRERVRDEAHRLKGLAANLSLPALRDFCLELETRAKNETNFDDAPENLKAVFAATLREINRIIAENG